MENKFIDEQWLVIWDDYITAYKSWKQLKLIDLLDEAKKELPDFKKEQIKIPLLLKIFDLENESSKNVLDHILLVELGYTQEEILRIHERYKIH